MNLGGDLAFSCNLTTIPESALLASLRYHGTGPCPASLVIITSAPSHHPSGSSHPALCPDRLLLLRLLFADAAGLSQLCKFFYPPQLLFLHALTAGSNLRIKGQILLLEHAQLNFFF